MITANKLFLFKGKTFSKLLVILFAALLCSVLLTTLADGSAAAVNDEFEFEGINYKVISEDSLTVEVVENSGISGDVVIPSTVEYDSKTYSVVRIMGTAFENCTSLTSMTIPGSVQRIGANAFNGCSNLISVVISDGVKVMGLYAFKDCSSLTSLIIPDSVTSIGNKAFEGCSSLTNLTMPIDIAITKLMFGGVSNLMSVTLTPGKTGVGAIYSDTPTESNYREYTPWYLSKSNLRSLTIMDGVISIGDNTFRGCDAITSIKLPDSVTTIGNYAFGFCFGVSSVTIGNNVTLIGNHAFDGCTFLSPDDLETPLSQDVSTLKGHIYSGSSRLNLVRGVDPLTVSFTSGEETILSYEMGPGARITTPIINKESTAQYHYELSWEGYIEEMRVTENVTFSAIFTEVLRSYTVKWVVEGSDDVTELVPYGTIPTFTGIPAKAANADYTFTFNKWNVEPVAVTGPATYTAIFYSVLEVDVDATGIIENIVFQNLGDDSLIINVMKDGAIVYSWTFSGPYTGDATTIFNTGIVATSDAELDEDLKDAIGSAKIENAFVLNFEASGVLPKNASVSYNTGDKYADGTKLSLFLYDEVEKKLVDQEQIVTVTDGAVTFNLTHCSSYVLAEMSPDATANNNTMLYVGIAIVIVVIISLVAVFVIRSRSSA